MSINLNSEQWTTQDGRVLSPYQTEDDHIQKVMLMLQKHADVLKYNRELTYALLPEPSGDGAMHAYEQEFVHLFDVDTQEWLERQTLYQTLLKESTKRGIEIPEYQKQDQ